MKKIFFLIFGLTMLISACVDDYTKSNPPHMLNAPTVRIGATGSGQAVVTVPKNQFQNDFRAYVIYGATREFTISVIDAPGKIGDISASVSVPDFGSVALDDASVSAVQGQTSGDFKIRITPSASLPDTDDRAFNLVVNVSDSQLDAKGEASPLTTTLTVPVSLVNGPCLSEGIVEGNYLVTDASGNIDAGVPYTLSTIMDQLGARPVVKISEDMPGIYTFDEVTGGVWPAYYSGRANPALKVDLCGSTISGHVGAVTAGTAPGPLRKFTINGSLNGDGTISITWSYTRTDAATPANPAKGTYKLSIIK